MCGRNDYIAEGRRGTESERGSDRERGEKGRDWKRDGGNGEGE